jgi:23S rRNA (cytosine1962-C5)-methyltransferase
MNINARLFNGRSQNDPHLKHVTVDRYGELLLITTYNQHHLPENFLEQFPSTKYIYWRKRTGKETCWQALHGELRELLVLEDHGLKFQLRFSQRQNLGFFLDMANTRHYLRQNVKGKKILNLFAYTCSFSVVAIAAGATSVTNVDMKSTFLEWGRTNHKLNKIDLRQVSFLKHNILKSLNGYIKRGPFDLIICDPPSYQPGGFKLEQDYPKILKKLHKMMAPKAEAIICCNDPLMPPDKFMQMILTYAENLTVKQRLPNPTNFDTLQVIIVQCTS